MKKILFLVSLLLPFSLLLASGPRERCSGADCPSGYVCWRPKAGVMVILENGTPHRTTPRESKLGETYCILPNEQSFRKGPGGGTTSETTQQQPVGCDSDDCDCDFQAGEPAFPGQPDKLLFPGPARALRVNGSGVVGRFASFFSRDNQSLPEKSGLDLPGLFIKVLGF